jgi:hypothetical protein
MMMTKPLLILAGLNLLAAAISVDALAICGWAWALTTSFLLYGCERGLIKE